MRVQYRGDERAQGSVAASGIAYAIPHRYNEMPFEHHAAPMNQLENETSPYLLQHADNPVEWYPWGPEALARARRENKPILLSIGYSACHWCHVMAHESFEDEATASVMNAHFVNVKVDREERPDLDKIYQSAHYVLTQNAGGWPLTMFLTPDDHVPFLGGTYFPREPRHGLPAFRDLLERVAETYREREADIRAQNTQVIEALGHLDTTPAGDGDLSDAPLAAAREQAARAFDRRLGGFGRAPKFPHPTGLERLLRDYARTGGTDAHALHMASFTLERMALGGIYDQLGGGFFRYSTDARWMIPHFEKMLYDNGPLLGLYAQAWQITRTPLFARVAEETAAWILRDMTSPEGAFYSSLDADSEREEGRYYVWDQATVREVAGDASYEAVARRFGLSRPANFEGRWHLYAAADLHEIANALGSDAETIARSTSDARLRLLAARERRIRPARDEKILTSWNALVIRGFAIASTVFGREDYADAAARAIDAVRAALWRDGRLLATCKDGRAHLNAYLDDYAFLADALLHSLAARWRTPDLELAIALADCMLEHFEDRDGGGFFFTAHDHEPLIRRTKPLADDALPAGNGVAASVLLRLGHLLGEPRYLDAGSDAVRAAWGAIERAPGAHNAMLLALQEALTPPSTVIVRGPRDELRDWQLRVAERYRPTTACFAIPDEAAPLPGLLAAREAGPRTRAYVCRGQRCLAPVESADALELVLAND